MAPPRKLPGDDILLRFFDRLQANMSMFGLGPLPSDLRERVELQIRQELGGETHYLPKAPARLKQQRLASALRSGANIKEAMRQAGVNERWGYRLLNRRA
jgi:hypothetical protein